MNFFAAKEKAYKNTFYLILLFLFGMVATALLVSFFILIVLGSIFHDNIQTTSIKSLMLSGNMLKISLAVFAIIAIGAMMKAFELSGGGKVVAEALNGRLIAPNTQEKDEKLILNVVQEMAIASGIPPPPIYLLPDLSINAFAAGLELEDAVIGITKGAIKNLNRQELQGIVAHEFSHIFNGDMKLNLRVTALLHGILSIGIIGEVVLEKFLDLNESKLKLRASSGSVDLSSAAAVIFGGGLIVLGFIGTLVGSAIKSLISIQREYLADASAVGYTRDITGIAGALKKIGYSSSLLESPMASIYSHLYFSQGISGLWRFNFPTHPPLKKRIWRLEPSWDGVFIETKERKDKKEPKGEQERLEKFYKSMVATSVLSSLQKAGEPSQDDIKTATTILKNISPKVLLMAKDSFSAQGLILSLLVCHDEVKPSQVKALQKVNLRLFDEIKKAILLVKELSRGHYLAIIQLCFPALKNISKSQYLTFRTLLLAWIYANKNVVFFEWNLKYLLIEPLDHHFKVKKPFIYHKKSINALEKEISFFISFLAKLNSKTKEKASSKFHQASLHVNHVLLQFEELESLDFNRLDTVFLQLIAAHPRVKKDILKMAIYCLSDDKQVSASSQEMLHAIAASFQVPLSLRKID